jgi:hypothetical protein
MYLPLVRECVRVEGRPGLFMVVAADYALKCADLIGVSSKDQLNGISFVSLFDVSDDPEPLTEGASPQHC